MTTRSAATSTCTTRHLFEATDLCATGCVPQTCVAMWRSVPVHWRLYGGALVLGDSKHGTTL